MITAFLKQNNLVKSQKLVAGDAIPADALWIDVQSPSEGDLEYIEKCLNVEIPSRSEVWKNHVLNRLHMKDGVAYMTAALITKVDSPYPESSAVTFILTQNTLLTIREIAPTSFRDFSQRLLSGTEKFPAAVHVLEGLLEEVVNRIGHNIEVVEEMLDKISHRIFGTETFDGKIETPSQIMKSVLRSLGESADLNSKINESLQSFNRLLRFFKKSVPGSEAVTNDIEILIADTLVLSKQTDFMAEKITFQLDATLGMINIEQNITIKIFSVVAVFFMPPTLLASLYGMNFKHMPELDWLYGYPMAICLMALFALIPYLYFRKKGWL